MEAAIKWTAAAILLLPLHWWGLCSPSNNFDWLLIAGRSEVAAIFCSMLKLTGGIETTVYYTHELISNLILQLKMYFFNII